MTAEAILTNAYGHTKATATGNNTTLTLKVDNITIAGVTVKRPAGWIIIEKLHTETPHITGEIAVGAAFHKAQSLRLQGITLQINGDTLDLQGRLPKGAILQWKSDSEGESLTVLEGDETTTLDLDK